jgi:hypothetical protein
VIRLICIVLIGGCGPGLAPGVPKGCETEVRFGRPIVEGLGLSSHLEWGESKVDEARRAQELAMWQELGPRVIRRDLSWDVLEPAAGQWSLGPLDRVLEATEAVDAELVALLDYGNPAYPPHDADRTRPVDDPADFARYAATIAQTHGDRLRLYEIWNEPNAGYAFWKPREDPEAYAALVQATVPAIRAADPDAFVALGGLFWPDLAFNTPGPEFLDSLLSLLPDLAGVDAVPIHPYRYPFSAPEVAQDHQDTLVEQICGARAQLDAAGLQDTELWVGELGWHTAPDSFAPGLSGEDQAAVLVRAAVLSFAQGATQFGWYTTRDSGTDTEDQEQMFGLVGYDPDPLDGDDAVRKPAFHAFATLSRMLGLHHTIRDLSVELHLDAQTYGYELSGGPRPVQVLWTDGPARVVQIPVDGRTVQLTKVDGASQTSRALRVAVVDLGPSPVFLAVMD